MATKTKKKLTAKQIKYFGTPHQKAALKAKRSAAAKHTTKKKSTSKKSTSRKSTSKKTVTTGQAIGIGLGSAAVGAVGGFAAGTLLNDQTQALLAKMQASNNSILSTLGKAGASIFGSPSTANALPIQPNGSVLLGITRPEPPRPDKDLSYEAYQAAIAAGQPTISSYQGGVISTNQGEMRTAADKAFDAYYT